MLRPLITLAVLLVIFFVSSCLGGFRTSSYNGVSKQDIQKMYLTKAKTKEVSTSIPIYSLNTTNAQEIGGNISGAFLFVSGSAETKETRSYKYVVKESEGYQFLNLNNEYKISSDKQVYINESVENPALVIKSYRYQDKRFDKLLKEYNRGRLSDFDPLPKTKYIFGVPKGTVVSEFEVK